MYLGSYKTSFDAQARRVALPKKIRDYLATSEIILTYGFDHCIFGFDTKSWQRESEKQLEQSVTAKSARDIRRFFFASANLIKLDNQGRFIIPNQLLEYAQVKAPVIIGAGDHFEIWDEGKWQQQKTRIEATS